MSDDAYERAQERAARRQGVEVTKLALLYEKLQNDELRAKLQYGSGASPWQRIAARRVLRERGEAT